MNQMKGDAGDENKNERKGWQRRLGFLIEVG